MSIITVKNLGLQIGKQTILKDVSFQVKSKELIGLIGPNGAGKTTLVRLLLGLEQPTSGTAKIHTEKIGYLPQILPNEMHSVPLTVKELLDSRCDKSDHAELFEIFDISPLLQKQMQELSGGQRQKVMFLRSLLKKPKLLILDEPFSAMDAPTKEIALKHLKSLQEEGTTILLISHNLNMLASEATQILCLNKGLFDSCHPENITEMAALFEGDTQIHHHCH